MMILLAVLFVVVLSGCIGQQELTCSQPYIKVGNECCLDLGNNSICDRDEAKQAIQQIIAPQAEEDALPENNVTQQAIETAKGPCGDVECFNFEIKKLGYDCLLDKVSGDPSYVMAEKTLGIGAVNSIEMKYVTGTPPVGTWKIGVKTYTPAGDVAFENKAEFTNYKTLVCDGSQCIDPFSYDMISAPYIENGILQATVTSPQNISSTKQITMSGDCNVWDSTADEMFAKLKTSFAKYYVVEGSQYTKYFNYYTPQNASYNSIYAGGPYRFYRISFKVSAEEGYYAELYHFDDVYKTTPETLATKFSGAAVESVSSGKFVRRGAVSPNGAEVICAHKAVVSIPIGSDHYNSTFLSMVDDVIKTCNA